MSGRTLMQGRNMEIGKLSDGYRDAVGYCELDETIFDSLGISVGDPVEVETIHGQVIVKSKKSRSKEPGVAFIPAGPYFNLLLDSDTQESGMPSFKGIEAKIFAAPGKDVTPLRELLKMGGT